ncbi:MAG: hypothetical protein QMD46_12390 [Methanomicrobiales archaeon]|nr:hypothetical protein [Methanomicrobiales archaeon]
MDCPVTAAVAIMAIGTVGGIAGGLIWLFGILPWMEKRRGAR